MIYRKQIAVSFLIFFLCFICISPVCFADEDETETEETEATEETDDGTTPSAVIIDKKGNLVENTEGSISLKMYVPTSYYGQKMLLTIPADPEDETSEKIELESTIDGQGIANFSVPANKSFNISLTGDTPSVNGYVSDVSYTMKNIVMAAVATGVIVAIIVSILWWSVIKKQKKQLADEYYIEGLDDQ